MQYLWINFQSRISIFGICWTQFKSAYDKWIDEMVYIVFSNRKIFSLMVETIFVWDTRIQQMKTPYARACPFHPVFFFSSLNIFSKISLSGYFIIILFVEKNWSFCEMYGHLKLIWTHQRYLRDSRTCQIFSPKRN